MFKRQKKFQVLARCRYCFLRESHQMSAIHLQLVTCDSYQECRYSSLEGRKRERLPLCSSDFQKRHYSSEHFKEKAFTC